MTNLQKVHISFSNRISVETQSIIAINDNKIIAINNIPEGLTCETIKCYNTDFTKNTLPHKFRCNSLVLDNVTAEDSLEFLQNAEKAIIKGEKTNLTNVTKWGYPKKELSIIDIPTLKGSIDFSKFKGQLNITKSLKNVDEFIPSRLCTFKNIKSDNFTGIISGDNSLQLTFYLCDLQEMLPSKLHLPAGGNGWAIFQHSLLPTEINAIGCSFVGQVDSSARNNLQVIKINTQTELRGFERLQNLNIQKYILKKPSKNFFFALYSNFKEKILA